MANTLLVKRTTAPGRVPGLADLSLGELAVNTTDGKLYFKRSLSGAETIVDVTAGALSDAEIFAKVAAQDGAGSGLDADRLDGLEASAFATLSGATFTGTVTAPDFVSSSDLRLKSDIQQIPDALAKLQSLHGVTFHMAGSERRQMGLIAQEVQIIAPEAVVEAEGVLRLAYGNLIGLLVEAIKDLAHQVEQLKGTTP
jgi:hypothetical protein